MLRGIIDALPPPELQAFSCPSEFIRLPVPFLCQGPEVVDDDFARTFAPLETDYGYNRPDIKRDVFWQVKEGVVACGTIVPQ